MRSVGSLVDHRRDRGNYAPGSQVMDDIAANSLGEGHNDPRPASVTPISFWQSCKGRIGQNRCAGDDISKMMFIVAILIVRGSIIYSCEQTKDVLWLISSK